jgi:hypothetical protein
MCFRLTKSFGSPFSQANEKNIFALLQPGIFLMIGVPGKILVFCFLLFFCDFVHT